MSQLDTYVDTDVTGIKLIRAKGSKKVVGMFDPQTGIQTLFAAAKFGANGELQALLDGIGGVALNLTVITVEASRELTQADNGATLDCSSGVELTVPSGLVNFGCAIRPVGTQIAFASGVTGNGDDATVTTTAIIAAINHTATADAYDIVGAE